MNKYHVKFSHIVKLPTNNQTNIDTKIIDVDAIYEVGPNVDIFSLIYSMFDVVGSVTVIAQEYLIPNETEELDKWKKYG